GGQIEPADPAVGAVAKIDDIIIAPTQIAEERRAHGKTIMVDLDVVLFAVDVPRGAELAGQADERKVLPIDIGGQDEIVTRRLGDIVEAAVGILFEPPEGRQIILEAIVVAIAEIADPELTVVEQEPAKIALKGLDADADRVEVVAVAVVAQMLVDKGFLHPDEMVEAVALL